MTYVQQFLKECCDVMPDQWALSKDLRDEYAAWAPDHAAPEVIGDEYWTLALGEVGATSSRRHKGRGWASASARRRMDPERE